MQFAEREAIWDDGRPPRVCVGHDVGRVEHLGVAQAADGARRVVRTHHLMAEGQLVDATRPA
jgi:hypothetical protein